jgi:nanoRNase/pAp phosphatase (c-di-AMP/oligoRNAs hydrolase)
VAVQDFPDPDAISSRMAYRTMAAEYDIEVDIVYEGRISHQENLALVHILSIDLIRFTEALPLDRYDGAIYIDNQGTTTRLTDRLRGARYPGARGDRPPRAPGGAAPEFTDVRPVGAAATIVTDYLRSGAVADAGPGQQAHINLATALVHGLRTETNGLVRAGADELLAASYLSRLMDPELLESDHAGAALPRDHGRDRDGAERAAGEGGLQPGGVGYLRHADRDAVPQAADFLITEENVHTAICYGIVQGEGERELVVGSVRTSKVTLDVDQFLKSALGSDFRGRHYGGGRRARAASRSR